jgi:DNA-directed RNA polymerase alpha subunit
MNNLKKIKNILLSAIPYSVYKKYGQAWKGNVSDDWDYDDSLNDSSDIPDINEWAEDEWRNWGEEDVRYRVEEEAEIKYDNGEFFDEASDEIDKDDYITNQDEIDEADDPDDIEPEYDEEAYQNDLYDKAYELKNEWIEEGLEAEKRDFIRYPNEDLYNEYIQENFNISKVDTINSDVQNVYKELFNGKERIILPLTFNKEQQFKAILNKNGMILYNYLNMLVKEYIISVKKKPENTLYDWTFNDIEALKNRCVIDDQNRQIRIAKILGEVNKKTNNEYWEKNRDFLNKQINSLLKEIDDTNNADDEITNGYIIISRHPYDIAGQSTDRRWTSCQNIIKNYSGDNGEDKYNRYVLSTITMGGLVAYLVEDKETGNKVVNYKNKLMIEDEEGKHYDILHDPIARITIKPFIERKQQMDFDNPNWILQTSKIYGDGTKYPTFIKIVQEWLDNNWNDQIAKEDADYYFDEDNFYNEDPIYKNYSKKSR